MVASPIVDYESQLHSLMGSGDFERAWDIVFYLQKADTLSYQAMEDCADCYIYHKKYQECIDLMDGWCSRFQNKNVRIALDYKYGEAYYYLGNYELAWINLAPFIDWHEENGYSPSLYYRGIFARALFFCHHYSDADKAFARYFEDAIQVENLPLEQLSKARYNYSYDFYNYAYNCFYMGDEVKGKSLLELSKNCGNVDAAEDLMNLSLSSTFAQEVELKRKTIIDFEAVIDLFDPKQYMSPEQAFDQESFWEFVQEHSAEYQKLTAALQKQRRPITLTNAMKDIDGNSSEMNNYLTLCIPYVKGDIEDSMETTLFGDISPIKDFRIYPAKDANAFATPYGHIYLTEGLVRRYHFNETLLIGVCAHEATHFVCQHSLVEKWQRAEQARKNAIAAGVVAGLYVATAAAVGIHGAANGVVYSASYWENIGKIGGYIVDGFSQDAFYFKFRYSRSQEIESDIIAYRFCETFGIGGYAYIMALQLLGGSSMYMQADKTADHPTMKYRISLLKYLYAKEHSEEANSSNSKAGRWKLSHHYGPMAPW